MSRSQELDLNDGGGIAIPITGDSAITKFGFNYNTVTDLFATMLRIRNENCEGFGVFPHTIAPWDDNTLVRMYVVTDSTLVPTVGHVTVRDASVFTYSRGVINSGIMEAFEDSQYRAEYEDGTFPTLDGEAVNPFVPLVPTVKDKPHVLVFTNGDDGSTETFTVLMHDSATFYLDPV